MKLSIMRQYRGENGSKRSYLLGRADDGQSGRERLNMICGRRNTDSVVVINHGKPRQRRSVDPSRPTQALSRYIRRTIAPAFGMFAAAVITEIRFM
jgi:hypothetical protein